MQWLGCPSKAVHFDHSCVLKWNWFQIDHKHRLCFINFSHTLAESLLFFKFSVNFVSRSMLHKLQVLWPCKKGIRNSWKKHQHLQSIPLDLVVGQIVVYTKKVLSLGYIVWKSCPQLVESTPQVGPMLFYQMTKVHVLEMTYKIHCMFSNYKQASRLFWFFPERLMEQRGRRYSLLF